MIFDVEADGLLHQATKLHVLSYEDQDGVIRSVFSYSEMREVLLKAEVLVGHNIICFDIPLLEKLLGIKIKAKLIDTLALSWYLNHKRIIHGLDSYGKEFGVPKPKIDNWENLTPEEYQHRCEEDVKINSLLYEQLNLKLSMLYGSVEKSNRLVNYLSFKMDCLRQQEESKWKLDVAACNNSISKIEPILDQKVVELKSHMPSVIKTEIKERPAKPYRKDGSISVVGMKWYKLLKDNNLPRDFAGGVEVVVGEEGPNPKSPDQVKKWLFSLGWKPSSFKYSKNKDGSERKIPQVRIDGEDGKQLCPSVLELVEQNEGVAVLDGVTVLAHRLSILTNFLKDQKDGWLVAGAAGFTNTLRLKHRTLVNLPGVDKQLGEDVRGCLVAPEGYILCGSDMTSLEDNTKKHYMWDYDPDYVTEMSDPNFDPHLDLAKYAKVVTAEEVLDYVCKKVGAKNLKPIRQIYKVANYSCVYGVGPPKLAQTAGLSLKEARTLRKTYWERNWAVLEVAKNTKTKTVNGEMWLFNPVSEFWYSLRYEKDTFSTLNQGTGVYCFDMWIREFRKVRPQLTGQFHDEVILCIKKGAEEKCQKLLLDAIEKVNLILMLNVTLSVDIKFGERYADIH